jgi:hypothetical protein
MQGAELYRFRFVVRHQIAYFKATKGIHPLPRGSKSTVKRC